MSDLEPSILLAKLMMPRATTAIDTLNTVDERLVHYTTAENALKILRSRSLWLRNSAMMNDFSEIQFGKEALRHCLMLGKEDALRQVLDETHPGLWNDTSLLFRETMFAVQEQTFVTSLSLAKKWDKDGVLSMWRAYGGTTAGAALVFNSHVLKSGIGATLQTFSAPVQYDGSHGLNEQLTATIRQLKEHRDTISKVPYEIARNIVFRSLLFLILSTKHNSFSEEKEWRLIHQPMIEGSRFVTRQVESLRGIPQVIYKVPMANAVGLEAPYLDLNVLLDRIIVGPCAYQTQVSFAFQEELRAMNIDEPQRRVVVADIPLRHQS